MKVYLAGPIFGCDDNRCKNWRDWVFSNAPFECLDPMIRDYRGTEECKYREIVECDKNDILLCDVVLVMYDKPSVGTSMEILYAWENRKKVVVVNASGEDKLSPWLVYHSSAIVGTLEEAVLFIRSLVKN